MVKKPLSAILNSLIILMLLAHAAPLECRTASPGSSGIAKASAPLYSKAVLAGTWLTVSRGNPDLLTFFTFDKNGNLKEDGIFKKDWKEKKSASSPRLNAVVGADGSLRFSFSEKGLAGTNRVAAGKFESAAKAALTWDTETIDLVKVSDPAGCKGVWTGELTETSSSLSNHLLAVYSVRVTVDGKGAAVMEAEHLKGFKGRMFAESGSVAGFFLSDGKGKGSKFDFNRYRQVQFSGTLSGNTIQGTYRPNTNNIKGTLLLRRR